MQDSPDRPQTDQGGIESANASRQPGLRRSTATLLVAGILLAGSLPVLLGLFVLRDPMAASRQFYRWRLGGEFLGSAGVVLQEYRNDCGPAALKMILRHYGVEISLEECRAEADLSPRGTSMLDLAKIARRHGVQVQGRRFDPTDLRDVPLPLLAYLRLRHFVVIERVDPRTGRILVKDPALGLLRFTRKELAAIWAGEALVFHGSGERQVPQRLTREPTS